MSLESVSDKEAILDVDSHEIGVQNFQGNDFEDNNKLRQLFLEEVACFKKMRENRETYL